MLVVVYIQICGIYPVSELSALINLKLPYIESVAYIVDSLLVQ